MYRVTLCCSGQMFFTIFSAFTADSVSWDTDHESYAILHDQLSSVTSNWQPLHPCSHSIYAAQKRCTITDTQDFHNPDFAYHSVLIPNHSDQVQEICKRTDYLSKDRLSVLIQIYQYVKQQAELTGWSCQNRMFVGKIVISAFRCSAEDVGFCDFLSLWAGHGLWELCDFYGINKLCLLCNFALSFFFDNRLL